MLYDVTAESRSIDPQERKVIEPELSRRLLDAQARLAQENFSVLVLFGGVDGAGKGETANQLCVWMDPRRIRTSAFGAPSEEEGERPAHWRYWRMLPPQGSIGIFLSGWYSGPLLRRAYEDTDQAGFDAELDRIRSLENMLAADGMLICKFWMHLGKEQQKARFEELEADPLRSWQVTDLDWKHWRLYDRFIPASEHLIRRTDTDQAPWIVIDGADRNYREVSVGLTLLERLENRLERENGKRQEGDGTE